MQEPNLDQESQESPTPQGTNESTSPSTQQGFTITLTVTPDGFRVSAAQPLPADEPDSDDEQETYPDLTTALKHIIAEVKSNPLGDDSEAQFAAGFAGEAGE